MKVNLLKKSMFAVMLLAGLTFTSCKDKAEGEGDTVATDTIASEDFNATPADTVVTDKDTVVEMGTNLDTKENPTGTQVP